MSSCRSLSDRNLSIGPWKVISSVTLTYPRPFMPISVANFSMFSKKLLDFEAQPGTLMARTVLPRKGAKSVCSKGR